MTAGGVLQLGLLIIACRRAGIVLKLRKPRLTPGVRRDIRQFAPTHVHLSVPDPSNHAALTIARRMNVPAIASEGNAAALTGLFAGVPAIVIGAGPSLDANLAAIHGLQERALLIAVDTAVRPLLEASRLTDG